MGAPTLVHALDALHSYLSPPFYYDLSKPEDTLESFVTTDNETSSSLTTKYENPDKTWEVPFIPGGALYYSSRLEDKIVKNAANNPQCWKNEWWTLENDSKEWGTITPTSSEGILRADRLAFSIGGLVYNWTDSTYNEWNLTAGSMIVLKSMLTYDTRKHEVKNVTLSYLPPQWGGVLEYVPTGKKGIDNSSHNIFVHCGTDGSRVAYSDTYVLSLPSFEWIKVNSGAETQSHSGHNCHMTTKHKMLVVGGRGADQEIPTKPSWDNSACDKYALLNIFDVNTLEWQNSWIRSTGVPSLKLIR
ncbi:hypothetical protein L873DRAFT_1849039 [Choiromyces venosus 120613-1]|uniref:Galactose oxidase n=1 Tax=Choiromyces venosus 120613-1 TaxID=1336337 RepID=A0A3N4IVI1_9PEZI|nr:hypothetical protein L873DRAFT_1849039 [Choiromyces venosus 120613-1]